MYFSQILLKSLAEAELDDGKDLTEEDVPPLNPVVRERGSVQLSNIQEPVTVRSWPMGLALASAPSITVSLTATGLQKMMSVMATLNLPSRRGQYKVETNQCTEELASIRAQPRVWQHFGTRCLHVLFAVNGLPIRDLSFSVALRGQWSCTASDHHCSTLTSSRAGRVTWRGSMRSY